jgi:hypothetical protein
MSFDIESAKKAGYSDAEIADHLAQSSGFDATAARASGYSDQEIIDYVTPKTTFGQDIRNLIGGAVRGAGSVGATLLAPIDIAARAMNKGQPINIGGYNIAGQDRRAGMTAALANPDLFLLGGADPESTMYNIGKFGGEIAGTAGAGGMLARGLSAVPAVASRVPGLIEALRSGGMAGPNIGTRAAGGAVAGGASAGLVNPEAEDVGTGAVVGAVAPNVLKVVGEAGRRMGKASADKYAAELTKFNRSAPARQTLKESIEAGYVVPPNLAEPSTINAIIESFSGKQATGQLASVRNQDVTEKLVREALGLAEDAPLTKGALEQIRKVEGGAYKAVGNLSPKAEMDLEALKQARNDAQGWFNAYNRSASPADLAKAKDFRDTAEVLELQLESHAQNAGKPQLIPALRNARKQIAKTYTVERALNDATGTVNARVLGRLYEKGKPLSDGLDVVGKFASGYPAVAQAPQQMGSPAAHNLRAMASMLAGGGGAALLSDPAGLALGAIPFAAPAAARSIMFRSGAQQALANRAAPSMSKAQLLAQLLQQQEAQKFLAQTAPAAFTSLQNSQ